MLSPSASGALSNVDGQSGRVLASENATQRGSTAAALSKVLAYRLLRWENEAMIPEVRGTSTEFPTRSAVVEGRLLGNKGEERSEAKGFREISSGARLGRAAQRIAVGWGVIRRQAMARVDHNDLGFNPRHAAAINDLLPDPLERATMIAFVARRLQVPTLEAIRECQASVEVELTRRRPSADVETIALASAAVVMFARAAELWPPATLH